MNENKYLFIIRYDSFFRFISISYRLIFILLGILFIYGNHILSLYGFIGLVFFLYGILGLIDIAFFKELTIYKTKVIKEWYFNRVEIPIEDLIVNNDTTVFGGRFRFSSKVNTLISFLFVIHLFPVKNHNEKGKELKKLLTELKVIKGDEYEWNI